MHLHVLTQRAGVRVALVAAAHFARVWLVARVHVRVLLAVAAVGEAPLAALELAPEGLLPIVRAGCNRSRASLSAGLGVRGSGRLPPEPGPEFRSGRISTPEKSAPLRLFCDSRK